MKRIGILGGMGPQATVLLLQKLIAAVPARDDADHVPLIVDQNPQVPSRIRHLLEGGNEDPGPVLAAMAQRLQGAGAQALAMPCNTAHHYAPQIRAAVSVPLIDMVQLSVSRAAELAAGGSVGGSVGGARIGILASPAVRQVGLFAAALAQAGLTPVYARDEAAMLAAIRAIKAGGDLGPARATLARASAELLAGGAAVQMIACTEFSLVADAVAPGPECFDTLDVLTRAIIAFATSTDAGQNQTDHDPQSRSAQAPAT